MVVWIFVVDVVFLYFKDGDDVLERCYEFYCCYFGYYCCGGVYCCGFLCYFLVDYVVYVYFVVEENVFVFFGERM